MKRVHAWLFLAVAGLAAGIGAAQSPDAVGRLRAARVEEGGILGQINEIDRMLHSVKGQLEKLQAQMRELDNSRTRHQDELASANALITARRGQVSTQVSALYRLHHRGLARVVFGVEDLIDLRRSMAYLGYLIHADMHQIADFRNNLKRREKALEALNHDIQSLAAVRSELQLKQSDLRVQRARRLDLLKNIRNQRELAVRALAEEVSVRRDLGSRLTGGGGSAGAPPTMLITERGFKSLYGKLRWPTTGRIVRRFGRYTDPLTNQSATSSGIELAAEYGTPFRAVAAGVVKLAEFINGYGQTVALEHGPYSTIYAHANGLVVRRGQSVSAGQQLGSVGNTGLTSGSEYVLGFEIRYNGTPQNPLPWLASK